MPNQKWLDQHDFDKRYTAETLIRTGEVLPMFVLHAKDTALPICVDSLPDQAAKDQIYGLVGLLAVAHNADAITVIAEAWMRSANRRSGESDAEHKARSMAVPPSEDESRIEVLMVLMLYREDNAVHCLPSLREIMRDDSGTITGLNDFPEMPDDNFGGALSELLPRYPSGHRDRIMAQAALKLTGLPVDDMLKASHDAWFDSHRNDWIHPAGHS